MHLVISNLSPVTNAGAVRNGDDGDLHRPIADDHANGLSDACNEPGAAGISDGCSFQLREEGHLQIYRAQCPRQSLRHDVRDDHDRAVLH